MCPKKIVYRDLGAGTDQLLENKEFKTSILEDVDGKGVTYRQCDFSYSTIDRGYFHKAKFERCKFIGTRFVATNFRSATFEGCDFSYADFDRCIVSVPQLLANLPSFANVRWELLHNLRANMRALGDIRHEPDLVWQEIETEIEHWRAVSRGEGGYYRKYTRTDRLLARLKHLRLLAERYIWGHGESLLRLFIATLAALMLLGLLNAFGRIDDLGAIPLASIAELWLERFIFVAKLFIDLPGVEEKDVASGPITSALAVILRYVSIGLAVPVLYKYIAKR